MSSRPTRRARIAPRLVLLALAAAGCGRGCGPAPAPAPGPGPARPGPAVPGAAGHAAPTDPAALARLLAHMNRGLAHLERYDYALARDEFAAARAAGPRFYPAALDLGVALLNLQSDPAAAERALRDAAALAPREAAPRFCLGMLLSQGVSPPRTAEALEAFRAAVEAAPDDADARHRLGMALKDLGRAAEAEAALDAALERNPFLGAALYQRGLLRRGLGREAEGMADLDRFRAMEEAKRVDAREISYGHMGRLAEAVRDLGPWLPPAAPVPGAPVIFAEAEECLDDARDPLGPVVVADLDGDGRRDLLLGGARPGWRPGLGGWKWGPLREWPAPAGEARPGPAAHLAAGDLDGDGRLDVVLEGRGIVFDAAGERPRIADHPGAGEPGRRLVADLDADGDLDLAFGRRVLLGDGTGRLVPSTAADLPEGFAVRGLGDGDDDGFPDLLGDEGWIRNLRGGAFGGEARLLEDADAEDLRHARAGRLLAVADFDADGTDDRLVAIGDSATVLQGLEPGERIEGRSHPGWKLPETGATWRAAAAADLDGDGDLDIVAASGGKLRFLANAGAAGPRTLLLSLRGVRSPSGRQFGWTNDRGIGVRVDVVIGRTLVRRRMGLDPGHFAFVGPPDEVAVGLGPAARADLVSLRWTEGVIQAEPDVAAGARRIDQVQRKAASCPVVFSWDGEKFAFVADAMGGGGLGFYYAPGEDGGPAIYGPPDPTERVRIAPELCRPRDGHYEIRLAEPLEEACGADRLALTAVDHPPGTSVYPDERFAGIPPAPGERVYLVPEAERILPARATDLEGRDLAAALAAVDRVYAEGFAHHRDLLGFTAAPHGVELDFRGRLPRPAPGERLVLLLDGWIEYGYSRSFYAAAGAGVAPLSPVLEVPDGKGGWEVAVADIGYPAGTPRTMTFDVTAVAGRLERFRIRTNLEIYWDRISLCVDRGEGGLVRTTAPPSEATLRFVGFPREVSPDGRLPKVNDYALMDPGVPGFKVLRGAYTRYGDVLPLVTEADDRCAVFRNGEEIALRFPVAAFPPLRPGWTRTFLLETEGWCKDMDPYTAEPETLEPLPFRGMSAYPPPPGESLPLTEPIREWLRLYQTRIVR